MELVAKQLPLKFALIHADHFPELIITADFNCFCWLVCCWSSNRTD